MGNIMRIGIGYDVHRLVDNRSLILGGVKLPFDKGLSGHSDADVLIHAIMDALLGAVGQGDIGLHFPDTDQQYRGISSMELLKRVAEKIKSDGFYIGNIDSTIIAERPKIGPYLNEMKANIAYVLELDIHSINIKATTTEGLGFIVSGEVISAQAVVLLLKKV